MRYLLLLLLLPGCATTSWLMTEALPPILTAPQLLEALHTDTINLISWSLHYIPYGIGDFIEPYVLKVLNHAG